MSDAARPLLAITLGDPAGIGPEVVLKALAHADVYERCRPLVSATGASWSAPRHGLGQRPQSRRRRRPRRGLVRPRAA